MSGVPTPRHTGGTAYVAAPEPRTPVADYSRALSQFREFDLVSLYRKVCSVPEKPRSRAWVTASGIFFGAGIGALIAGIPLLSSNSDLDAGVVPIYAVAVGISLLVGVGCMLAARSIRQERVTNMGEIKAEFARLLEVFGLDPTAHDPTQQAKPSKRWGMERLRIRFRA